LATLYVRKGLILDLPNFQPPLLGLDPFEFLTPFLGLDLVGFEILNPFLNPSPIGKALGKNSASVFGEHLIIH